jgi:hypothetical protein
MPFQLPALPNNLNVTPPQIQNPVDQAMKMASLKNMMSEQALRQQLAPLDVQEAQQRNQQGQIQIQQQQLQLANQQKAQQALSDPNFRKDFDDWQKTNPSGNATTPDGNVVDLHPVAQFLAEKKGLPLLGPGGALEMSGTLTGAAQKQAELLKTQGEAGTSKLKMHSDQIGNFNDLVLPVLEETDPAKQAAGVAKVQQEIKTNPGFYPPEATQHLGTLGTIQGLSEAANTAKIAQMQVDDATKKLTQTKGALEVEPVTPARLKTFTQTVNSFSALRPEQKQAAIAEAGNARTVDELDKVVARADATDKSEQMHADSMAQTNAFKGQAFGQKGLEANDKTWTDPQHGYLQTLSQANEGKAAIKAGADGNGLLTSLAPTMAVLGMNSFAGTHRISPAEAQAAGAPGGWAERANAWFDKAKSGKLSPQLATEGNTLFDQLIDAKHQASLQASAMHAQGYGIPPQNMPAMDRDGNVTTLDKVKAPTGGGTRASAAKLPTGATHIVPGRDGKNHYTNAAGTVDLGVAP